MGSHVFWWRHVSTVWQTLKEDKPYAHSESVLEMNCFLERKERTSIRLDCVLWPQIPKFYHQDVTKAKVPWKRTSVHFYVTTTQSRRLGPGNGSRMVSAGRCPMRIQYWPDPGPLNNYPEPLTLCWATADLTLAQKVVNMATSIEIPLRDTEDEVK